MRTLIWNKIIHKQKMVELTVSHGGQLQHSVQRALNVRQLSCGGRDTKLQNILVSFESKRLQMEHNPLQYIAAEPSQKRAEESLIYELGSITLQHFLLCRTERCTAMSM